MPGVRLRSHPTNRDGVVAGARRLTRTAVAAAGAGVAALAVLAISSTGGATAAGVGQQVVGAQPLALTQPADALLGRMAPAQNADVEGMFAPQVEWPLMPIHVALAPNGHLISYGSPLKVAAQEGMVYDDWDPAAGTVATSHQSTPSMGGVNSFCNQLELMPDGRLLMVGGNSTMSSMAFDPQTKIMTMGPNLQRQRWYPTVLRRPDDRFVVIGGANFYAYNAYLEPDNNAVVGTVPEIGDGTSAWKTLTGATSVQNFGARENRWWYPRAFNAPDGNVFGISGDQLWTMSTAGDGAISNVGVLPASIGSSGAAVMYAPGKILTAGGNEVTNATQTTATNAAALIDLATATPQVVAAAPMKYRRNWLNLTVLPDSRVLANGGTVVGTNGGADNSSYTAELWDPATGRWSSAASAKRIRTYHSVAVLMPSGAVVTAAGGVPGPEDNFNAEMFYPPSLFTRGADGQVRWAARPKITSIAGDLRWGGTISLGREGAAEVTSVNLIKAGAVTHAENTDQRRIPLSFVQTEGSVTATIPTSRDAVPPGTYLLSIVDAAGVPSPSQLVTIRNGAAGLATVFDVDRSAGQVGGDGVSVEGVRPLDKGTSVSLEPFNGQGYRLRHQGYVARIDPIGPTATNVERTDSAFVVRAGLASATGISLEASQLPGYFLATEAGGVYLRKNDGTAAFGGRATFLPGDGLAGQATSLRGWNDKDLYLRRDGAQVRMQAFDGSDQFRMDASFRIRAALGPAPGYYRIANANSGLRIAPAGGAKAAGTAAVQAASTDRVDQEWELRDAGAGRYKIVNAATGLVLGIEGMSRVAGGNALIWGDTGTADHLWQVVPRDGRWVLINDNSGLVLGITNASKAAGAKIVQWNDNGTADHLWDLAPMGALGKGRFGLANLNSGLVLGTRNGGITAGAGVVQETPSAADTQAWTPVAAGGGTHKLYNQASGLVLGLGEPVQGAGTVAVAEADDGAADHQWRLVPRGGRWFLVNGASTLVLGVNGASKTPGAAAVQWTDNGTADHLWTLVPR